MSAILIWTEGDLMCVYPGYHFSRTKINCAKITNLFNVSELLNCYPNISCDCFFQQMCSIFAFQDRLLYGQKRARLSHCWFSRQPSWRTSGSRGWSRRYRTMPSIWRQGRVDGWVGGWMGRWFGFSWWFRRTLVYYKNYWYDDGD